MLSTALMFGSVKVNAAVVEELPLSTTKTAESLESTKDVTVPNETENKDEVTIPDETEAKEEVTVLSEPEKTEEPEKLEESDNPTTEELDADEEVKIIATYGPVTVLSDGNAYLSDENGNRITTAGTPKVAGNKYYVATDGYLRSGWLYLGSWKMYFDTTTYAAKTGMSDIGGKKYLFNDDGVMETFAGTPIINGKKYWFSTDNASLKTGWLHLGQWKMYFDPETYAARIGMTDIDGCRYLFNSDGVMETLPGTPVIDDKKYWFSTEGYLKTGWLYLGQWKMYFDPKTYAAKVGLSDIDGKKYLFNSDGVMENFAGTPVINGKKYWFSTDNASLKTGWLHLGEWKMYFDPETYQGAVGITNIDGENYFFNEDCLMETGFLKIGSSYYYFSANGAMVRNTWIGDRYFDNTGAWAGSTFTWPCPGYTLITSDYGYRDQPTAGASTNHKGIDIGAPGGSNIVAISEGTVVAYGYNSSMGNYVKLQHANGVQSIYMHMSRIANLSIGQEVSGGSTIGYVGSTGISTGAHLHLSVMLNGSYVSPWNYLSRP